MRPGLYVALDVVSIGIVTWYFMFSFRTKDQKEQLEKYNLLNSRSIFFKNAIADAVNNPLVWAR